MAALQRAIHRSKEAISARSFSLILDLFIKKKLIAKLK